MNFPAGGYGGSGQILNRRAFACFDRPKIRKYGMKYSDDQINDIYDSTDGRCHICRKKIAFINYGKFGRRGCWEVDQSNPQAKGGTNRKNNLKPACMSCNRSKGSTTTKAARGRHGHIKAPLSKNKKSEIRAGRAIGGGLAGGALGAPFGPIGAAIGLGLGALIGHQSDIDE